MSATVIKDVTRALQALLLNQLNPGGTSTAQVSLVPPGEALPTGLGVNLYLYRVIESPSTKNQLPPGDRPWPRPNIPALGLELSYLLTPFATVPDATTASGDDAHTMLGTAMLVFHENPVLNNIHMPGFDADSMLPADLLNSVELVKIRLATTSLEELSKIWATINQPYRLSVAYDVSLVMVPPSVSAPAQSAPGVSKTAISLGAWSAPALDGLTPPSGALAHVGAGGVILPNSLAIAGSGLSMPGRSAVVKFGGQPAPVAAGATDTSLTVSMPLSVAGGPSADVLVKLGAKGSFPLSFLISPWLAEISPLRTALDSSAGNSSMALTLKGEGFTSAQPSVRFDGPGGTTSVNTFAAPPTDSQVSVNIPPTLANGIYNVRVVLGDAAASVSNSRVLAVIPFLLSPVPLATITVNGSQVHQLTLSGARLNGGDVRILLDGAVYAIGSNTNATQIIFTLGRLLSPGTHSVGVSVDSQLSHFVAVQAP